MLLCQEAQVGENGMLSLSMKCDRASSPAECRAMKLASLAKNSVQAQCMLSLSVRSDRVSSPAECRAMKHAFLPRSSGEAQMDAQRECEARKSRIALLSAEPLSMLLC